jgi:glyceraldehyde 3-phosphate dehydrogenase
MLPASTGSAKEVHRLFPDLDFFDAESLRVNIPDGSVAMLTLGFLGRISAQNVIEIIQRASQESHVGIIGVSPNGMFLEKVLGKSVSSLIDPKRITAQHTGEQTIVNLQAWFDNEWGYANRVAEVAEQIGSFIKLKRAHSYLDLPSMKRFGKSR